MSANVKWAVTLIAAVVLGGCSDSSSTGIPYAAEDLTIETQLNMTSVQVGGTATATCTVTHTTAGVVSVPTSIVSNPTVGVRIDDKNITPDVAGLYNVGCLVTAYPTQVVDVTPVTLTATTSGAAIIDTVVTPEVSVPGEAATVECIAKDWAGNIVEAETTFTVVPADSVTVEENTITTLTEGKYEVICSLVELPSLLDGKPAVWTVESGEAATVIATLDATEIASGSKTTVTCRAEDANGNAISGLEYTVSSTPDEGLFISGTEINAAKAGEYEISCAVVGNADIPSTPDVLLVTAGTPVEMELFVDPEEVGYAPGAVVTFSWNVLDSQGNVVENSDVTLTAPTNGVAKESDNTYKLLEEGAHSFTAKVTNSPTIKATRVLYVDAEAPELEVTYPTRGLTLTQTEENGEFVEVSGTILDPVSGVAELTINDNKVSVADDGSFSFSIQSVHGLNVVDVVGVDAAGNVATSAIGYYFSTVYQDYEETTIEDVKIDNAMKVFLGKDVIDDGVHDPTNIDDLATLIEVVLTTADLNALIGGEDDELVTIPNVVQETIGEVDIAGDVVISISVVETTVSEGFVLNLNPIDGGVQATGAIPPAINESGEEEDGLVLQVALNIALELKAQTVVEAFGNMVPVESNLAPTLVTQTYARVFDVSFETTYDIHKDAEGPLNVDGKNFKIVLGELEIDPIQDTIIDLGTAEFTVFGIPLPFTFDLGQLDLASIFDPIGGLIGSILNPAANFLSEELDFIFKPVLEDVAADTLKAALLSLELETSLEVEALEETEPGQVDLKGELYTVDFTEEGGTVGIKAGAWSEKKVDYTPLGSIMRDSCAGNDPGAFEFSEDAPMAIGLNIDFVNEFLFSIWWNSALNMDIAAADLDDSEDALAGYGIKAIRLNPLLPPILSDCNEKGLLRIQLGDAEMEVDFDGGLVSEPTTMKMFTSLDAGIYVQTNEENSLSIEIQGFEKFHVDLVDAGPEWESYEAELEAVLEAELKVQVEALLSDALGDFPVPSVDLTDTLPGVPEGTALQIGATETALSNGYLLVEGDLVDEEE